MRLMKLTAALTAMSLSACATSSVVQHHERGAPLYFGGTRLNLAALSHDVEQLDRFASYGMLPPSYPLVDLPLSLAADLVLTNPLTVELGKSVFTPHGG